ncbi:CRISPR-associated protein Cst1 [Hathewaya proteolytica DSM 3090]|uniref:CRISPR-associated protein Cst1 n=1 Tax=Hathewaya proteolytica DSM 3090 TaxID=1121331 RepID=A0A1M6PR07_9CLOT|nr:type I-B CRISPR-associated protein Cas8b1/Cst1 [Hathewaya proteolytica]SHK10383.1 CRISPR-associated protein Cst1 [Hathewaya proteolytica DSM 3090]
MASIKVYMNDWFMNMGIVGFLNILKHSDVEEQVEKKDNYIKFDSALLENFHEYYFSYFMNEYDMSKRMENSINYSIAYATKNNDKVKEAVKRIRDTIKYQADNKIKKFDLGSFEKLKDILNEIINIKTYDEIEKLKDLSQQCIDIFKIPHINERLTLNLYKYIIGDNYFGQVSYFNVLKSSLDANGLKKVMYNDYLLPLVYYYKLQDIIEDDDLQRLKNFMEDSLEHWNEEIKAKAISKGSIKNIEKFFKDINNKYIKKGKNIGDIKEYVDSLETCQMCGNIKGIMDIYTESNFAPLAVSSDNALNLYWNMNPDTNICPLCKLILFCTPAGTTPIRKKYISNGDNEFYGFVNMDTSIDELYSRNLNLKNKKENDNPFNQLIIDIVEENKERSKFQLQNIMFVEFKASIDAKKCVLNYFNMPVYLAEFFTKETSSLNRVKSEILKAQVIDYILKNKDLKHMIYRLLKEKINFQMDGDKKVTYGVNDIYNIINIRYILNEYKKGGKEEWMRKS